MLTGTIIGTCDYGACGIVPLVRIDAPKPRLRNNGCNAYCGHPRTHVPGLAQQLPPDACGIVRQGHVMLTYADGQSFGTYASDANGDDVYTFC